MLRVRLDACAEVDGLVVFDGQPLTGAAFAAQKPAEGAPSGLLEGFRYEDGVRVGSYVEPLLDDPTLPILEAFDAMYDDFGMDQVIFNGARFDGVVADFDGPHLERMAVLEQGDTYSPLQVLSWNSSGSLRALHRRDCSASRTGLTLVRQFANWSTDGPDDEASPAYRASIQLAAGYWGSFDRVRLLPDEQTEIETFQHFQNDEAGCHYSTFGIGVDAEGKVNYLDTHKGDFFGYMRDQDPQFEPVVDFPRSWDEITQTEPGRCFELRLNSADLDQFLAIAGGYSWFDKVEDLTVEQRKMTAHQAEQLFNAPALNSLTIVTHETSNPAIDAVCDELAKRRPDITINHD